MQRFRIPSTTDFPGGGRTRALATILGTIAAASDIAYGPIDIHGIRLPLFPASIMIVTLLGGWKLTGITIAAAVGTAALLQPGLPWQLAVLALISAAGGEALRQGIRPIFVALGLMLACFACGQTPLMQAFSLAGMYMATEAGVISTLNVALATTVLLLMPRRGSGFPVRRRIGWNHIVFVLVVGTSSITILGLLGGTNLPGSSGAGNWEWRDSLSARLALMVTVALLASVALGWWCEQTSRRLPERYGRRRAPAGPPPHRPSELPQEVVPFLTDLARDRNHERKGAERSHSDLAKARQILLKTQHELRGLRELLKIRSMELSESIRVSENARTRHALVMETSTETTIFTDGSGRIETVSAASGELLGYEPAALVGKHVSVLIPAASMLDHPLDASEQDQTTSGAELRNCSVQLAGGKLRDLGVLVRHFNLRNEAHRMILLRETDHMSKALAVFEQAKDLERSAHRSRDLFIATMSHEMRTPLHGLIATLDMMRANESTTDFQHQLAIARTSARALLKIANDVLDLTRVGSNLFHLERQPFSMARILSETVDEARARAASLGLSVVAEIDDKLPNSFIGDPARLKQILGNLVSNALKFTANGDVRIKVGHDGRNCILDVKDTGEGIPDSKRERIFEPFVQLSSRNRPQVGGTGLGLPISRRLAEAMGGSLVLLNSSVRGSTFRLTLPLESSDELPPDEQSQRVFRNPRGRILVVEDNPANRYVAQALLSGLGCPATIVDSGHEALEQLRHQEFDLILMDCQLPGMDGRETTRRARQILKRRIPIIAITANAMAQDQQTCLEAGMDDFLPKPFGRQALSALLCKWLTGDATGATEGSLNARADMRPDLEVSVLDELWESLNSQPEPMKQIRNSFIGFLEKVLLLLNDGAKADKPQILRHLHTALGSAGMVGARQIEYIVTRLEAAVKENRLGELVDAGAILERAMQRYEREFNRWFRSGAPGRPMRSPKAKDQRNYA